MQTFAEICKEQNYPDMREFNYVPINNFQAESIIDELARTDSNMWNVTILLSKGSLFNVQLCDGERRYSSFSYDWYTGQIHFNPNTYGFSAIAIKQHAAVTGKRDFNIRSANISATSCGWVDMFLHFNDGESDADSTSLLITLSPKESPEAIFKAVAAWNQPEVTK